MPVWLTSERGAYKGSAVFAFRIDRSDIGSLPYSLSSSSSDAMQYSTTDKRMPHHVHGSGANYDGNPPRSIRVRPPPHACQHRQQRLDLWDEHITSVNCPVFIRIICSLAQIATMPQVMSSQTEKTTSSTIEEQSATPVVINASGHVQELDRNFSLLSLCAVGIITGNAWTAAGGTIVSIPSSVARDK